MKLSYRYPPHDSCTELIGIRVVVCLGYFKAIRDAFS